MIVAPRARVGASDLGLISKLTTLIRRSRRGTDISNWPSFRVSRAGLVMVPEGRKVFAPLSVEENLSIGGFTNKSKNSGSS